jgi:hypothetical protein
MPPKYAVPKKMRTSAELSTLRRKVNADCYSDSFDRPTSESRLTCRDSFL